MIINSEDKLRLLSEHLANAPWVAIDTEADSLHAYPEKLCLLQISMPGRDELIDPLAGIDLAPFLAALAPHELIFHGADYDLRLLQRTYNFKPTSIFDTMLAARLCGYMQFGLNHLVHEKLKVSLEKGPQKMNWALRPLSERMIRYARNDTHYLFPLAAKLREELAALGRLEWHAEMCTKLIEAAAKGSKQEEDPWRIGGSDRLEPEQLAFLRELWLWREAEAKAVNTPPYFILSHEKLLTLAASKGEGVETQLPRHWHAVRREAVKRALNKALHLPKKSLPKPRVRVVQRATSSELSKFHQLKILRDKKAHELRLDPSLVANKAQLLALAKGSSPVQAELMSWQTKLLGL